ncbi:Ig-like domain-containing protein [Actinoplanes couchii]|uniref:Ig-like domain repeat protein n=1 Tax=Actinoplanes couchii TaxID=403638 RepID=A0ABQ3XI55_9ACTN|nr:Ig-like domain-containing protein [Actinoplanes couchii]MDR6324631.1 hypothetical protein [Actinoplanes couchii]GID58184.1 hypothetical protein Aco03nite_065880 [Actinoplanes couchii]
MAATGEGPTSAALDMAISPDGDRIATAHRSGYGFYMREAADLETAAYLSTGPFVTAVDFAADGTVVAGMDQVLGPNLAVFTPSGELIKNLTFATNGRGLVKGVAWAPEGDRLFGVSANGNAYSLLSYTGTKQAPTTLTLNGPSAVIPGATATFSGRLTTTVALPAGTTVTITRDGVSLGTATVGATGTYSFTDTPPADAVYRVSFAGDDSHQATAATRTVQVTKATATVTLLGPATTAIPGERISVTGRLTAPYLDLAGSTAAVSRDGVSLGTVTVDADEYFTFADTLPGEGTVNYSFSYAGSNVTLPAVTTHAVVVSRVASAVTLAGPTSAPRAKALTLTGTLASPLALPSGAKVSITRTDLDSPSGKALGTVTVAADGSFRLTDTPPAGGTVTYRVAYAGDGTHTAAAATWAVAVSRATPALTLTNGGKVYDYGKTVTFTARLGATYKNRVVEIWADPAGGDQARRLLKRATVNSKGDVAASFKLTRDTTLSAVFTGDARYAPRTVTVTVGTRADVGLVLRNYYKTKTIGGTRYSFYKPGKTAYFKPNVNEAANRRVRVQLQRYSGGKWKTMDDNYFEADDVLYLSGSGLTNAKLRTRLGYVRGTSRDSLNVSTWTTYRYFTFAK